MTTAVGRPAVLLPYGNRGSLELPYTKNSPEEKNNDLVHFYVLFIFLKFWFIKKNSFMYFLSIVYRFFFLKKYLKEN